MLHYTRILLWRLLAAIALLLGLIGVLLPGLPTVPLLLLAAWAGNRGWPQLETYLLAHPVYGEPIRNWRQRRAVPRRAKWIASLVMVFSSLLLGVSPAPMWMKWSIPLLLLGIALWLWRRAEI
jgi:uncharacterized membrane protein YbaN (DUF454 family)